MQTWTVPPPRVVLPAILALALAAAAAGQESDVTQTPNSENAGIKKSLEEQVGSGRGDPWTPDGSLYLIQRDPFRSIARGRQLFQRKFTVAQGFGPPTGDGVGDIELDPSLGAGLVDSCAGCHGRPRGSAGAGGNVFTRPDSRDAPHLFGLGLVEMLADEITVELRAIRQRAIDEADAGGVPVTLDLVAKGISYGRITADPGDDVDSVDTSEVAGADDDLRVRPFFAEGRVFSIREFVVGALDAEMGLESPDPDLLAASQGAVVVTPAGLVLDGTTDTIAAPPVDDELHDGDGDGVVNEVDPALVDHLEFYLLNYFKPGRGEVTNDVRRGRATMGEIGCTTCHVPDLVIEVDRRVADVETVFDPVDGVFNRLFATATPLFVEIPDDDPDLPPFKLPAGEPFVVTDFFSDLKRHDLGPAFHERTFAGDPMTREHVTEPLWGVGSTAPYGHDGRSISLLEVILRHGGAAEASRGVFEALPARRQQQVLSFLRSLVLFPPPDTASTLDPADEGTPGFPQRGHGSMDLSVLFNDPGDKE